MFKEKISEIKNLTFRRRQPVPKISSQAGGSTLSFSLPESKLVD